MTRISVVTTVFFFLTGVFLQSVLAAGWGYEGPNGPSDWGQSYPDCKGDSQSPINIYEGDVTPDSVQQAFAYKNYDTTDGLTMEVSNNGHGSVVSLSGFKLPEISGGGLPGDYVAAQFHFHWSTDEKRGSEHLISSEGFPSELHIVHYKKSYGDINTALNKADGLAVLGFMLEISQADNFNYNSLVDKTQEIYSPDSSAQVLRAQSLNSYLPERFENFFRYSGSLTTPPCFETVTWTVFKETIKISRAQLSIFMNLEDEQGLFVLENARPVMPINGREITANFDPAISWGYMPGNYDAAHWPDYYEKCGGESQSPINIPSGASVLDNSLGAFSFNGFGSTSGYTMRLSNNGHTVTVSLTGSTPFVTGGGLPERFNVAQFHFHWGQNSMRGSEHTLDAKMYPMEVHIVMYKASLGTLGAALKQPEGLAVLGFFFEVSANDNTVFNPILNQLNNIQNPNTDTSLNSITLDSILPNERTQFYRYPGSLTTPGCYESVIWTVFNSKIPISEAQLNKLRALKSKEKDSNMILFPMVDNYRPVQFLNNRVVRRNFQPVAPRKQMWTYFGANGTQSWDQLFSLCASDVRQSPININPKEVQHIAIPEFEFENFDTTRGVTMKLVNNGHSVTVAYESGNLQVSGGGLPNNFKVAQFHFHWGSVNSQGSEHTLAGQKYPMEIHIVMYNELYNDIGVAMTQGNGLAVLGFMFEISEKDNTNLDPLVNHLKDVKKEKTEAPLKKAFKLESILPDDVSEFFRYDGSLTTPTCDESVTWTVFYKTIAISEKQLNKFRNLQSVELDPQGNKLPMVDNYRPVQDIGQRIVYSNSFLNAAPSSKTYTPAVVSVVFTLGRLAWSLN